MGGFNVVCPCCGCCIAQGQSLLAAGVMHREFLSFNVVSIFSRPPSDRFGGPSDAFGKDIAEALSEGDLANHLQHPIHVAETQIDPVGLLRRQNSPFGTFHGKGDANTR